MSTREILTLQFGHYSNYIGTHWWNLQESNFSYDPAERSEINHDVLYREGETSSKKVTFTPRLLLVDLKGSLGYLSKEGSLYDDDWEKEPNSSFLWNEEQVETVEEESAPKTPFIKSLDENPINQLQNIKSFNLETDINSWPDYLVSRFHPRTVNVIKEYQHQSSDKAFDIFNYGKNIWRTNYFSTDFCDSIRQYVEECDLIQGFQVLLDSTDGFAGLGTSCIEYLRDEYGKSILAFPVIEGTQSNISASSLIKAVNIALCWQQLTENASLFSPLCCGEDGWPSPGNPRSFDHLSYNIELKYHTSALLATALDTLSLRYRHKNYTWSALSDLCADLNKLGRKTAATSLSLPFPMVAEKDLIDVLDDMEGPLWTSLTPSCRIHDDKSMHSVALRGIPEDRLKRPPNEAKEQLKKPAYKCSSVHEMMTMYLAYSCHASASYLTNIQTPLKISLPFPQIFKQNINKNGDLMTWAVKEDVKSVPVMAGLHSGSGIKNMFETLHSQLSRIRSIKKFYTFEESGLEQDEFFECLNYLQDSKEAYEDNYM
ncbi:protein misato [Chelonus insularis]|uniref:protein misato n=1 Tax=Chelonus insularis TaxID=460826 RepID=UPI00158B6FD2|nr:protein misato [Chelonus insularis]